MYRINKHLCVLNVEQTNLISRDIQTFKAKYYSKAKKTVMQLSKLHSLLIEALTPLPENGLLLSSSATFKAPCFQYFNWLRI